MEFLFIILSLFGINCVNLNRLFILLGLVVFFDRESDDRVFLIGLLRGVREFIFVKYLEDCLIYSEYLMI